MKYQNGLAKNGLSQNDFDNDNGRDKPAGNRSGIAKPKMAAGTATTTTTSTTTTTATTKNNHNNINALGTLSESVFFLRGVKRNAAKSEASSHHMFAPLKKKKCKYDCLIFKKQKKKKNVC